MLKKILIVTALLLVTGMLFWVTTNQVLAKTAGQPLFAGQENGRLANGDAAGTGCGLVDCTNLDGSAYGGNRRGQEAGFGNNGMADPSRLNLPAAGELSADEAAALSFMREEEKLARDLYQVFYAQWNLPVFQNISQSEQAHMDAIKALLDRYELSDPAQGTSGVFTNPDLQALYTDLAARGSQSLSDALKVGALVEETDIADLQERLAQTDNADIQQVFNNLLKGSYNHLRAYVSTLENQTGETYQPKILDAEAYQTILGGTSGRMMNGGNGKGNGYGRNGGRP